MRLWHYKLLPYLPDKQFRGQLRELVAIMHTWRDKEKTNHLLINRVMNYDKGQLTFYFMLYEQEYFRRYSKWPKFEIKKEFMEFCDYLPICEQGQSIFKGWHNGDYLKICMANLFEKWYYAQSKSKITDMEWSVLLEGYKDITGDKYYV